MYRFFHKIFVYVTDESEAVTNFTLQQDIGLSSACGTPQYTNFTAGFADCLDYIFYDNQNLTVDQVSNISECLIIVTQQYFIYLFAIFIQLGGF